MGEVDALLGPLAARAEAEIRPRLGGLFGGMLRQYLPQVWLFRTERGAAALRVGPDGAASVLPGEAAPADVTIEVGYARLAAALAGTPPPATPGPYAVATHTAKGTAAFDYLRGRLGL